MRLSLWALSIVVYLAGALGCALPGIKRHAAYETIEANPQRNSALAEEAHDKALKIIKRHLAGKPAVLAKAERHLQEALVADVKFAPAHNTMGTLYFLQHKLYLAAWEYEFAAKLMPERIEPLYNLGMVYESARKLDRAIMFYQMAFSLEPHNPHCIGNLARARLRNGETVEEVRFLLEEIPFYDTRPDWIAWAHEKIGLEPVTAVNFEELPSNTSGAAETLPEPVLPELVEPIPADEHSQLMSPPRPMLIQP